MSVKATKIEYTIGFVLGLICIISGIILVCYQFFINGYIFKPSPNDLYDIFAGWAILGVLSLTFGSILVYSTYKILIPLRLDNFEPNSICSKCGAIVAQDAVVCEKCKQPIDTSTQ